MRESVKKERLSNFFILILKNIPNFLGMGKEQILQEIKKIRINYTNYLSEKEEIKKTSVNASLARALNLDHGRYLNIDKEILKKINFLIT